MSAIKLVLIIGVISVVVLGILIFPASIEKVMGVKNATTENYTIASKYSSVSWDIVVPLDSDAFILERNGIIKFIKIVNKSAKPMKVRMVKDFDRWECKTIDDKVFGINYTIYKCKPIKVKIAFINVTTDSWKLSTLGIFFRKNGITYVIGDTFAEHCSPTVNQSYNCSKSNAVLMAKIKVNDTTIVNKMYSDDKLNISLNSIIKNMVRIYS